VVHFGESPAAAAEHMANAIAAAHPDKPRPPVTPLAKARNELAVIPTQAGDQLVSHICYVVPHPFRYAQHLPLVTPLAKARIELAVIPTQAGDQLVSHCQGSLAVL